MSRYWTPIATIILGRDHSNKLKQPKSKATDLVSSLPPRLPSSSPIQESPVPNMNLECPHCKARLSLHPSHAGAAVTCPKCQGKFQTPLPTAFAGGSSRQQMYFAPMCFNLAIGFPIRDKHRDTKGTELDPVSWTDGKPPATLPSCPR